MIVAYKQYFTKMNASLLVKNATTMMVASANDMKETNAYLGEIISIISYIFISIVGFGVAIILCMFICGNLNIILRIIRSCCIKCDCCDRDEHFDEMERRWRNESEGKIRVVILPSAKVMDAC